MPKTREDANKENKTGLPLRDGGADYSKVTDLVGLIKTAEGLRTESYWDFKQYSVGYGSKGEKGEVIDEAEAEKRLANDISNFRAIVVKAKETHGYDWNSDQIDALTSFTHNLGATNFNKLIDGGKRGDEEIIEFLPQYNKARVNGKLTELAGLTDRRNMELKIFEQGFES
jgi:GH24 family phage-related lysozyme (muramidase)